MEKKIKDIIENEMDCLITDVDFVIKKEGNLQALVNMLEVAINYTHSCTELKDKEVLTFKEFVKTFIKTTVHNETYFYKNDEFNKIQKVKEIYNKKILNL